MCTLAPCSHFLAAFLLNCCTVGCVAAAWVAAQNKLVSVHDSKVDLDRTGSEHQWHSPCGRGVRQASHTLAAGWLMSVHTAQAHSSSSFLATFSLARSLQAQPIRLFLTGSLLGESGNTTRMMIKVRRLDIFRQTYVEEMFMIVLMLLRCFKNLWLHSQLDKSRLWN